MIRSLYVSNLKVCPICGETVFTCSSDDGVIHNNFACGTTIELGKFGNKKGKLVNRCSYNVFSFFKEKDYDMEKHYDASYLDNLDIKITGFAYHTTCKTNLINDGVKIYSDGKYLNLKGGTLVSTALLVKNDSKSMKAIEKYVNDYNSIVDGEIYGWEVLNGKGEYVDLFSGFIGDVYEQAKEYMSEYDIYKEEYDEMWNKRGE